MWRLIGRGLRRLRFRRYGCRHRRFMRLVGRLRRRIMRLGVQLLPDILDKLDSFAELLRFGRDFGHCELSVYLQFFDLEAVLVIHDSRLFFLLQLLQLTLKLFDISHQLLLL
ncbi:MAG: hypothetical protein ACRD9L_09415, partial [Bryobacteraceae bacterium]